MPSEASRHEGTWLQWPHQYTYGLFYRMDLEPMWVEMTRALAGTESVHIIAYNEAEKTRISNLLSDSGIDLSLLDFHIYKTNDCWVRDNGPIFVYDSYDSLFIVNWGFNGWGGAYAYNYCDHIPDSIGDALDMAVLEAGGLIVEGGAMEVDGNGSLIATRSSIINSNRNPGLTESQIEDSLSKYMGIENFIWLDGVAGLDITDMHIDGFVKFKDSLKIISMDSLSLIYWQVPPSDISTLFQAVNADGIAYSFAYLPLTQNNVVTTYGTNLGYKGSYVNFYEANEVVLVPNYADPNDGIANSIIQTLYPDKTVIGVDSRNLYAEGGMVHCVTQQQPIKRSRIEVSNFSPSNAVDASMILRPNPTDGRLMVSFNTYIKQQLEIEIYDLQGRLIHQEPIPDDQLENQQYELRLSGIPDGEYVLHLLINGQLEFSRSFIKSKP